LLKEKQPGLLSGSLRSINPEVDASAMASLFGGGGHKQAAGFKIKDVKFEEGVKSVIDTVRREQEKRHGIDREVAAPTQPQDLDLGQTEE
ncbi:hypothetical protein HN680_02605, partial [Candidatus Peregrinibacteria bacterium]|nr:hypothetical protein [Candidatus Peregrinibacteria bacterium]